MRAQHPADLVAAAFLQAELRQRARAKFSRAAEMLFTRDGLEQATAETVARHRARRLPPGARVADLGCGIGGDLVALAAEHPVIAVDRDQASAVFAAHNAVVYRCADVSVACADAADVSLAGVDVAFVDPSRRRHGRRLSPLHTDPPLAWCLSLPAPAVVVKAAPGLPRTAVPAGWQVEFVATGRDLKEAVLWSPMLARPYPEATVLPDGAVLAALDGPAVDCRPPGPYLLDPNPAVTRAGAVQELARRVGGWQLDPRIAFISVATPVRTPFARLLRVRESLPWQPRLVASAVRSLGLGRLDVRTRGVTVDAPAITHRLRSAASGRGVLVLTRVGDRHWALICTEPDEGT